MDLGPHATFILAAYAIFCVVLTGLIAWLVVDGRNQQALLDEIETRMGRRRGD